MTGFSLAIFAIEEYKRALLLFMVVDGGVRDNSIPCDRLCNDDFTDLFG